MVTVVYGVVTPPLRESSGNRERDWFFEKDELEALKAAYVKKPVLLDHNPHLVVGTVLMLDLDSLGNLGAYLAINTAKELGNFAMHRIETGESLGLSINFEAARNEISKRRIGFNALEISIVKHPVHEGSRILRYGNREYQRVSKSGIHKIFLNMDTTIAPPQTPLPSGMTQAAFDDALAIGIAMRARNINVESLVGYSEAQEAAKLELFKEYNRNASVFKEIIETELNGNQFHRNEFQRKLAPEVISQDHSFMKMVTVACGYKAENDRKDVTIHDLQKEVDSLKTLVAQNPKIERPDPLRPTVYDNAAAAKRARLMPDALNDQRSAITPPVSREDLEAEYAELLRSPALILPTKQ